MLYIMHKDNLSELTYHSGQEPIIHLEADLHDVVAWADNNGKRWVFTLSNAGANYFEDRNDLNRLNEINWTAVMAHDWRGCKEGKQAEFLIEEYFPWCLISQIGVYSSAIQEQIYNDLSKQINKPPGPVDNSL